VGVGARLVLLSVMAAAPVASSEVAGAPTPLREVRGAVTIDWTEGTLTALGAAAADLHMPSAELARPGAERRARAAALASLRAALGELPLGGGRTLPAAAVELACQRARSIGVEEQSNGGALVRLQVAFSDWLPAEPPTGPALSVGQMRLGAAPKVKLGKQEIAVGIARYRAGPAPAAAGAVAARVERDGRLVAAGEGRLGEKLAGAAIVIYVQKVLR
jgi:hypothetical protein